MVDDGKRTENLTCRVTERMLLDLNRMAAYKDITLSSYLYHLIRLRLYGEVIKLQGEVVEQHSHTKQAM